MNHVQNAPVIAKQNKNHQHSLFLRKLINSFISLETPSEHYSYNKIAKMLGISDNTIKTYVVSEMVLAIEQASSDPAVMNCSVDSIRRVLELRQLARSWGIDDDTTDAVFNSHGKKLLKSAFS